VKTSYEWIGWSAVVGIAVGVPAGLALARITNLPAGGVALAIVGWFVMAAAGFVLLARVSSRGLRVVLQSAFAGFVFAPSIIAGHGAAPAPAWLVIFLPSHLFLGLIPMVITAVIISPVFMIIARSPRHN